MTMERTAEWRKIRQHFLAFLSNGNTEQRLHQLDSGPTFNVCMYSAFENTQVHYYTNVCHVTFQLSVREDAVRNTYGSGRAGPVRARP